MPHSEKNTDLFFDELAGCGACAIFAVLACPAVGAVAIVLPIDITVAVVVLVAEGVVAGPVGAVARNSCSTANGSSASLFSWPVLSWFAFALLPRVPAATIAGSLACWLIT